MKNFHLWTARANRFGHNLFYKMAAQRLHEWLSTEVCACGATLIWRWTINQEKYTRIDLFQHRSSSLGLWFYFKDEQLTLEFVQRARSRCLTSCQGTASPLSNKTSSISLMWRTARRIRGHLKLYPFASNSVFFVPFVRFDEWETHYKPFP